MVDREEPSKACLMEALHGPLFLGGPANICLPHIYLFSVFLKTPFLPFGDPDLWRPHSAWFRMTYILHAAWLCLEFPCLCGCAPGLVFFLLLICFMSVWFFVWLAGPWRGQEFLLPDRTGHTARGAETEEGCLTEAGASGEPWSERPPNRLPVTFIGEIGEENLFLYPLRFSNWGAENLTDERQINKKKRQR